MISRSTFAALTLSVAVAILAPQSSAWSVETAPEFPAQIFRIDELDLRDASLRDALTLIGEPAGLNLAASAEAAKTRVTIRLHNLTPLGAVQAICQTHGLYFNKKTTDEGIDTVTTVKEFQDGLTVFREEKTEVFTLLYPNATSVAIAIRDLYGDRVQLSLSTETSKVEQRDLDDRFTRFDTVDSRSQGIGIFSGGGTTTTGGGNGGGGSGGRSNGGGGGGSGGSDIGINSSQAVRRNGFQDDTNTRQSDFKKLNAEQAEAVGKVMESGKPGTEKDAALQALRGRPADIYVTTSQKNNLIITRTSDYTALREIKDLVCRLDVPTPMVLLEVKVMSIDLSDGFSSVFDYQFTDGATSAGGFSTGNVQPPAADLLHNRLRRAASLGLGGTGLNSGDMTFQFVNDNFRARLQLLETKNKITMLATPMLLTANNEVSRLFVGEERPIIRNISSSTVVNNNTTTSTPTTTVEFRPVGTTLLITPTINSDRTVTLRILQENSSINPAAATIPVVTSDGGVSQQPVDVVATRTISGTVIAKDELMVAIGGLIEDSVHDSRAQVPILGRIPVLGVPFRRQSTGREKRELIVLCRPHVLSTPGEAEAISQKLLGELSIHPNSPEGKGTLNSFSPREVLRPNAPVNRKESILKPGVKYEGN